MISVGFIYRWPLCLQDGKLRWHTWTQLPNHRVMCAVDKRSLAPLVAHPQLPPPSLHLPSSQYPAASPVATIVTLNIQHGPLNQCCPQWGYYLLCVHFVCFISALNVFWGFQRVTQLSITHVCRHCALNLSTMGLMAHGYFSFNLYIEIWT